MTERADLLTAIGATISDYRSLPKCLSEADHVDRWISQFDAAVQLPMLRELNHVFGRTYISAANVKSFLETVFSSDDLAGHDKRRFWRRANLLHVQERGNSQREMLAFFNQVLLDRCAFDLSETGKGADTFVYFDDGLFTGSRIRSDLRTWVANHAPQAANLHVVTITFHTGGQYYAQTGIEDAVRQARKAINIRWWRNEELEDSLSHTNNSDVLRPKACPDDAAVRNYVAAMNHPPVWRSGSSVGPAGVFSSDAGRELLEVEFLKAGVRIRNLSGNFPDQHRPLGYMRLETLGFGSMIVTFRNCPNNAPLALWAGDPWYPLFPRRTNADTQFQNMIAALFQEARQ